MKGKMSKSNNRKMGIEIVFRKFLFRLLASNVLQQYINWIINFIAKLTYYKELCIQVKKQGPK